MQHLSKWVLNLLMGSLLMATTLSAHTALAQSRRYTPPRGGSAPTATGMGGARTGSCTREGSTAFTALAPISHVGQTAAPRPAIAIYVPDGPPLPIDFRLYQSGTVTRPQPQLVYQTELDSQPGIMSVTLPSTEAELTVGQRYYWQAALICDPNHGSEDLIVGADLEVVASTVPESERWYDLLQIALNETPPSSTALLQELSTVEQTLGEALAQVKAPDTAEDQQELSQTVLRHSQQLNRIVAAER